MAITSAIIGIIVSAIFSAIFSESIVRGLGLLLSKIDLPNQTNIEGIWRVTFTIYENNREISYKESIKIVKRLGIIYGYNVPDSENHTLLKMVENNKPLRIRGQLIDNRYFTGVWFHPNRKSRFHGSYQLLLHLSGNKMIGSWTGYSESKNSIDSGKWIWLKESYHKT